MMQDSTILRAAAQILRDYLVFDMQKPSYLYPENLNLETTTQAIRLLINLSHKLATKGH